MRLNRFIALASGVSRRRADELIAKGLIKVNGQKGQLTDSISNSDTVTLDGKPIKPLPLTIIILNKPVGYVCSRDGQGSSTIYDLFPGKYHNLKPVGRLDKDSSGLILLTNDGELANNLTHPRYQKEKVYEVKLDKTLNPADKEKLLSGVKLSDGVSKFIKLNVQADYYEVILREGRNRQIRRTFEALGYKVTELHRTKFGDCRLEPGLKAGEWSVIS